MERILYCLGKKLEVSFKPSRNPSVSLSLSLSLWRRRCLTSEELVLQTSRTPILSSSSTSPSVNTRPTLSSNFLFFHFLTLLCLHWLFFFPISVTIIYFLLLNRNWCGWFVPALWKVWQGRRCLHPQRPKVLFCLCDRERE